MEQGKKIDIGFIGAGTVGTALAVRLSGKGYPVVAVSSRTKASAQRLAQAVSGCKVYDDGQAAADSLGSFSSPPLMMSSPRW